MLLYNNVHRLMFESILPAKVNFVLNAEISLLYGLSL